MIFRVQWFFFSLRDVNSFFVSDGEMRQFLTQRVLLGGLLDEAGDLVCTPGFYFYDTDHHQFFFGGKNFLISVRNFIDKNPKEVNEMASY